MNLSFLLYKYYMFISENRLNNSNEIDFSSRISLEMMSLWWHLDKVVSFNWLFSWTNGWSYFSQIDQAINFLVRFFYVKNGLEVIEKLKWNESSKKWCKEREIMLFYCVQPILAESIGCAGRNELVGKSYSCLLYHLISYQLLMNLVWVFLSL